MAFEKSFLTNDEFCIELLKSSLEIAKTGGKPVSDYEEGNFIGRLSIVSALGFITENERNEFIQKFEQILENKLPVDICNMCSEENHLRYGLCPSCRIDNGL